MGAASGPIRVPVDRCGGRPRVWIPCLALPRLAWPRLAWVPGTRTRVSAGHPVKPLPCLAEPCCASPRHAVPTGGRLRSVRDPAPLPRPLPLTPQLVSPRSERVSPMSLGVHTGVTGHATPPESCRGRPAGRGGSTHRDAADRDTPKRAPICANVWPRDRRTSVTSCRVVRPRRAAWARVYSSPSVYAW